MTIVKHQLVKESNGVKFDLRNLMELKAYLKTLSEEDRISLFKHLSYYSNIQECLLLEEGIATPETIIQVMLSKHLNPKYICKVISRCKDNYDNIEDSPIARWYRRGNFNNIRRLLPNLLEILGDKENPRYTRAVKEQLALNTTLPYELQLFVLNGNDRAIERMFLNRGLKVEVIFFILQHHQRVIINYSKRFIENLLVDKANLVFESYYKNFNLNIKSEINVITVTVSSKKETLYNSFKITQTINLNN